jgi:penicillin-binding protein 2
MAVSLTLDIELQRYCEQLLKGELGAIAVLNADTGAVLAMASVPTYDPSVFVTRGRDRERLELLKGGDTKPMRNRAYQEQYPPGSVYKVMLAAAALEEGIIDRNTTHYCPGSFRLNPGGRAWNCWRRHGHGSVAVVDALAFSCDVFFYNVGIKLGVDKINEWSHKMGLGVPTGIDLPAEVVGLIPNREWKAALNADKPVWEQNWYPGETVNLSIGQGSCTTTPLQNAVMMASVVNEGYCVRPYLNEELGPRLSERIFSEETLEIVRDGLRKCVQKGPPAPTGTGNRAHIAGVDVIGKTGTAQIMSLKHHEQFKTEEDIPYRWRDHAWFVAGVLDREPKLAICILVEHGHHGSSAASPFAKDIIEFFYAKEAEYNDAQGVHLAREHR